MKKIVLTDDDKIIYFLISPIVFFILLIVTFFVSPYLKRAIFPNQNIDEYYHEGQYCIPGKWVEIPFNVRSFNGIYRIYNINTTMYGGKSLENEGSGEIDSHFELPNKIFAGDSSKYINRVGIISFKLPKDKDLYGKQIMVSYSAKFASPQPIGDDYFVWKYKNIGGVYNINIGTRKQSFYSILFNYVVIISLIPISPLFTFTILKLIVRYNKD